MRTVELHLSVEFVDELSKHGVGLVDKRITDAVGYLSMWGLNGRAEKVRIYGDKRGEMTATYSTSGGADIFCIGAVPDDNWNYSFHS